ALLDDMPMTALVRNLATMTRVGALAPGSAGTAKVVTQLGDRERIHKARVHPIALLAALRTYAAGRGVRGRHSWTPVTAIADALAGPRRRTDAAGDQPAAAARRRGAQGQRPAVRRHELRAADAVRARQGA